MIDVCYLDLFIYLFSLHPLHVGYARNLMQDGYQFQIVHVDICLIKYGFHMNV